MAPDWPILMVDLVDSQGEEMAPFWFSPRVMGNRLQPEYRETWTGVTWQAEQTATVYSQDSNVFLVRMTVRTYREPSVRALFGSDGA
jgi:hypothetical protein